MPNDPAPNAPLPSSDPKARLRWIFEAAGCRTQVELAAFLGGLQSSVSDAKRRGSIPPEWLITLLLKQWINPAWILTGAGSCYLQPTDSASPPTVPDLPQAEPCPPKACSTETLLAEVMRRMLQKME